MFKLLDNEETVTEVENSENKVVGILAEEIIQETQKADISISIYLHFLIW